MGSDDAAKWVWEWNRPASEGVRAGRNHFPNSNHFAGGVGVWAGVGLNLRKLSISFCNC